MFESFKDTWSKIQRDPPGKRFRRQYRRRQAARSGVIKKILFIGVGLLIILAGVFLLPAPGPGMLVILIGLGLVAQESLYVAIQLDHLEVYLRKWIEWLQKSWGEASFLLKSSLIILGLIVSVLVVYSGYLIFLK